MARVLVIEDDSTQRLLTSSMLKSAGHEVLEATDGAEGLQLVKSGRPEVIVCDVMMPGINGYQFVTAIKDNRETATIPVILLSAMKERAHIRVGMTAGADDYLPKPFSAAELKQSVASMLNKRRLQLDKAEEVAEAKVAAALQDQRQALSGKYEMQLLKELNQRWEREIDSEFGLHYPDAPVLAVELLGHLLELLPTGDAQAQALKRLYEATSDALHLFGARHVQSFGPYFIAIFANDVRPDVTRLKFQAVRAAFAVRKAVRTTVDAARSLSEVELRALAPVSLHCGPVRLLRVGDPLHGTEGVTLLTGEAVSAAVAINQVARARQWPVCCSTRFASDMADLIDTAGTTQAAAGDNHAAVELTELIAPAAGI